MTATIERRITSLESNPPPPPDRFDGDWPGDDPPEWWAAAPPALRRYLLAGEPPEDEMADLIGLLSVAHAAGERLPLVKAQSIILWWRWCAVFAGGGADPFGKFWGGDGAAVFDAYRDRETGAALVALWRASGTRNLDPAALRLLSATE